MHVLVCAQRILGYLGYHMDICPLVWIGYILIGSVGTVDDVLAVHSLRLLVYFTKIGIISNYFVITLQFSLRIVLFSQRVR